MPTRTRLQDPLRSSVEFKLYLIKEFQRLKDEENDRLQLDWNLQRTLANVNYLIHTDAIKATLIPSAVTRTQAAQTYAEEPTFSTSLSSVKLPGRAHHKPRIER